MFTLDMTHPTLWECECLFSISITLHRSIERLKVQKECCRGNAGMAQKRCVQLSKIIWGPQFPSKATIAFRLPSLSLLLIENRETDDAGMHRNRNGGRGSKCNNAIQQFNIPNTTIQYKKYNKWNAYK